MGNVGPGHSGQPCSGCLVLHLATSGPGHSSRARRQRWDTSLPALCKMGLLPQAPVLSRLHAHGSASVAFSLRMQEREGRGRLEHRLNPGEAPAPAPSLRLWCGCWVGRQTPCGQSHRPQGLAYAIHMPCHSCLVNRYLLGCCSLTKSCPTLLTHRHPVLHVSQSL